MTKKTTSTSKLKHAPPLTPKKGEKQELLSKIYAPPGSEERKQLTLQCEDKLAKARGSLGFAAPFFSYLRCFLKTELIWPEDWPISGPATAFCDGKRIVYNPMFVLSLEPMELCVIEIHEVLHPALQHTFRCGTRIHLMWNIACDYVVNNTIKEFIANTKSEAQNWKFPEHFSLFISEAYESMSADQIYADLYEKLKKMLNNANKDNSNAKNDLEKLVGKNKTEKQIFEQFYKTLSENINNRKQQQQEEEEEENADQDSSNAKNVGGKGISPEEALNDILRKFTMMYSPYDNQEEINNENEGDNNGNNMREVWLKRLMAGYHVCKIYGAGAIPSSIQNIINEFLKPVVDWRSYLKHQLKEITKGDYNWSEPNRYYMPKFYLPALHSKTLGHVVVCIDTSGSTANMQQQFISEAISIFSLYKNCNMTLIECDAQVGKVIKWKHGQKSPQIGGVEVVGQGGTSFVPPFEYIRENNVKPKIVIYMTDLDGFGKNNGLPPIELHPHCPVMWVCTNNKHKQEELPFGTLCEITEIDTK